MKLLFENWREFRKDVLNEQTTHDSSKLLLEINIKALWKRMEDIGSMRTIRGLADQGKLFSKTEMRQIAGAIDDPGIGRQTRPGGPGVDMNVVAAYERQLKSAGRSKQVFGAETTRGYDLATDPASFKTSKKPIDIKFEIADKDQIIKTKEADPLKPGSGEVLARRGDAIMTGTKGERWPIARETFIDTYKPVRGPSQIPGGPITPGIARKKNIPVTAKEMPEAFEVKASWGDLSGKPGDFLVQYGPDDFGIVSRDIFKETYN